MVNIPANPNALRKSLEDESVFLEAERKRLQEETEQEQRSEPEVQEEEMIKDRLIEITIVMARASLHK